MVKRGYMGDINGHGCDPDVGDFYPDEDESELPDDLDCTYCGGDGFTEGKDPCWDEGELSTCPNCKGSGLKKDMTFW